MNRILAFDPSLTCTGWAVLEDDKTTHGRYILSGYITTTAKGELCERLMDLAHSIGERARLMTPDTIIIETPASTGRAPRGQSFRGTAMTSPIYGAAVGACIVACGGRGFKISGVPSDEWTRARIPSSRGDCYKGARVKYAAECWGLDPDSMGPKTIAGNIADALLIARWRLWRERAVV